MPGRTTAAKRFAEAVAAIARQDASWEQWRRDLGAIGDALRNAELRLLLESPRASAGQRRELLERAFADKIAPATMNLLKVMARRGRMSLFEDLLVWFNEIADREMGVRRYTVTTAAPLDDEQRRRLRDRLAAPGARDAQLILTERVDPALLGGLVLQQEDVIRDYSVKARLESLRERLN